MGLLAACRAPTRTSTLRGATLAKRISARLAATGTYRDAEQVVLAERGRGEDGRGLLLMEALWEREDLLWRPDFLLRLTDVPRPERAPYVEQQLGLEPYPPLLYSSAAPRALRRVAAALSGQGLMTPMLDRASQHVEAGEYLEAAGVLTLAQLMLPWEPEQRTLRAVLSEAWQRLARQRRCVAKLYDAAQTGQRLLNPELPRGIGTEQAVAAVLLAEPESLPCALIAAQMATTQAKLGSRADGAARALLAPTVISPRYASLHLVQAERAAPRPMVRGDARLTRETLERGMVQALQERPQSARLLLPLAERDPGGLLVRERREDLALRVMLAAPPVPEVGEKIRWAYQRHLQAVAGDPRGYVAYMARLGPDFATALVLALREPAGDVLAAVVTALAAYPPEVVERALGEAPYDWSPGRGQEQRQRELVRALFRLPLREPSLRAREDVRRAALDLHRCCRGDRGTCDRLAMPAPRACPAWTPLQWW